MTNPRMTKMFRKKVSTQFLIRMCIGRGASSRFTYASKIPKPYPTKKPG